MARHMMQRDMFHNDMAANHAAVSYYAGTSSVWGFYWYAYFSGFVFQTDPLFNLPHHPCCPLFQNKRRRKS